PMKRCNSFHSRIQYFDSRHCNTCHSFMGSCICHKKDEYFSMNDLNGIDKYYSLMSKRKANILIWLIDSKGPWETPESFLCFKQSVTKFDPVKVSNEDEIEIRKSNSKSIINRSLKHKSSMHVDQKEAIMKSNFVYANVPVTTSTVVNYAPLLDCASDW
ncbi:unnamed protein product, partial [Rotaria socialis]